MAKEKDFYKDLAARESSHNPRAQSRDGTKYFAGLYQMGEAALVEAEYYVKRPKPGQKDGEQYNNDWTGTWKGKNGINSIEDFLSKPHIQHIAIREYHKKVWDCYLKGYHQYEGREIGGIKLTKTAMIAGAHLAGQGKFKDFVDSGGRIDKTDNNGVPCSHYMKKFGGHTLDFSIPPITQRSKLTSDLYNERLKVVADKIKSGAELNPFELATGKSIAIDYFTDMQYLDSPDASFHAAFVSGRGALGAVSNAILEKQAMFDGARGTVARADKAKILLAYEHAKVSSATPGGKLSASKLGAMREDVFKSQGLSAYSDLGKLIDTLSGTPGQCYSVKGVGDIEKIIKSAVSYIDGGVPGVLGTNIINLPEKVGVLSAHRAVSALKDGIMSFVDPSKTTVSLFVSYFSSIKARKILTSIN